MEKANLRAKIRNLQRLILNNFGEGDHWVTLTYDKDQRPETMDRAKMDFRNFMVRLKRACMRLGVNPKWIRNIEQGSKGGWHIHFLIGDVPGMDLRRTIQSIWQIAMKKGRIHDDPTYSEGGFQKLAAYLSKGRKDVNGQRLYSFSTSRNLERTTKETKSLRRNQIMKGGSWKEPKIPKGYYLEKSSYEEWINPITGFPCRRYLLLKIPTEGRTRWSTA
ncbi:MAG: hypothetical protein J6040_02705 [Clostridiales bacterium]|nr:hypothetical protein [Clostridiales bacterium]